MTNKKIARALNEAASLLELNGENPFRSRAYRNAAGTIERLEERVEEILARDAGIAGVEFLRSIPGTVGGFVRMNGGAYGRETSDILVECDAVLRSGERVTLPAAERKRWIKIGSVRTAAIMPATLSILTNVFRVPRERGRAVRGRRPSL